MADFRYGDNYSEIIQLKSGRKVKLRPVWPSDKELMLAGFEKLSRKSRYNRFHGAKSSLREHELRHLTELDGIDHFAIGAVRKRQDGSLEGLGVARFVRLPDEPTVAEPAIAIIDKAQGQGLGSAFLVRLSEAAYERGIGSFRSQIMAGNKAMRKVLKDLAPGSDIVYVEEDSVTMSVPLPMDRRGDPTRSHSSKSPLEQLLSYIARNVVDPLITQLVDPGDRDRS